MKSCFLPLLLVVTLSTIAHARQYVVNQKNNTAADSNPGTPQKPLKTISAAAAKVQAGDRVIIHAGQYRETVIINASGIAEAPIIFEAAPDEIVVIKGSDVIKDWTRESGEIWKTNLPPVLYRSADPKSPSFWRTNDVRLVFAKDGALLDAEHLRRVTNKDQLRAGTFFCDVAKNQLFIWLSDSSDPNAKTMEIAVRGAWLYVNGNNIIIRGLQMRHSSTLGIATWPACRLSGENIVMKNCIVSWGDFVAISLSGNRNKLLRCTIACHGNSGVSGTGKQHVIEKCRVVYNNIDRYDLGWHCGGAKLIPQFSNSKIKHNEFAHNVGPGLWLDSNCDENRIEANLCHDNEGPGIMVEVSARNRVFNNICFSNRNPLAADFLHPEEGNKFAAVRFDAKDRLKQIPYHAGDGRGIYNVSSPETKIYHNTCYLNEGEGICVEGDVRKLEEGFTASTHDCSVLNNISVYNKGTQLVLRRNGIDKDTYDNKSDYNILFAVGAVFARGGWDGAISASLKEWKKQAGQDEHSQETDPFFAMAAMGDFRLLPISPAVNTGQPFEEVRQDFFGDTRPQNGVTIGACQKPALDYPRPAGIDPAAPESP
jgi:parallel beta-helix repeat protein